MKCKDKFNFRFVKFFLRVSALLTIFIVIIQAFTAAAQDDDPIPVLDFGENEKAIGVRLNYTDSFTASLDSVEIIFGRAPGRAGNPPLLRVEIFDLNGDLIEQFNAWHPLWVFPETESGRDSLAILPEAAGRIIFPYRPDAATMHVIDVETQSEIIEVDLIPHLHNFCRENSNDPDCDGLANRLPECNAGGKYLEECAGPTTSVTLDGTNSSDPDGDPLTYIWTGPFESATAIGPSPTVQFSGFGQYSVDLNISDDFGGTVMCSANVEIIDTAPPTIECNAPKTIVPPDAPISFTATATDVCEGIIIPVITEFDCFMFTKKGKRIDKRNSCVVDIQGDTVTIQDSGGVGDNIIWTIEATDSSGNPTTEVCQLTVEKPGKGKKPGKGN